MPRKLAGGYDRAIIRTPRSEANLFDLAVLTDRVGQPLASIVQRRVAESDRSKKEGFVVCHSIAEARRKLSSKHFDDGMRIFAAEKGGRETGPLLMMRMADLLDMLEEARKRPSLVDILAPTADLPAAGKLTLRGGQRSKGPTLGPLG
jgi:hypothetical protein